jgi:hypothetical protein
VAEETRFKGRDGGPDKSKGRVIGLGVTPAVFSSKGVYRCCGICKGYKDGRDGERGGEGST